MKGKITTHNGAFAFIKPDGVDKDIFAHSSQLPKDLFCGDYVTFSLEPDPYKPGRLMAINVTLVDEKQDRSDDGASAGASPADM